MKLLALLGGYSLGFWRHERWKSLVTLLGMSLGLGLFFAIQLANKQALSSFSDSATLLHETTAFEVRADSGEIPETIIPKLLAVPGVESVLPEANLIVEIPRAEGRSILAEALGLNVLAVNSNEKTEFGPSQNQVTELLKTPRSCWITHVLNDEVQQERIKFVWQGEEFDCKVVFRLPKGKISSRASILFDITQFQDLFSTWGKVNTLRIVTTQREDKNLIEEKLSALLPPGLSISRGDERSKHAEKMTQAFRLNLQFLSGIALFVAMLLVYNTVSFFILKRRKDLGVLQALGVHRRHLRCLILCEAGIAGLLASICGLTLAIIVHPVSQALMGGTLQGYYGQLLSHEKAITWAWVIESILLGPLIALLATYVPSREVLSIPIRETFALQTVEFRFRGLRSKFAFVGIMFLLLALVTSLPSFLRFDTRLGFLPPTFLVFGACALLPRVFFFVLEIFEAFNDRLPLSYVLARDHLLNTALRNVVAIASVMVALGMACSMSIMIASFRNTVGEWILGVTKADLYLSGRFAPATAPALAFAPEVVQRIESLQGIRALDLLSSRTTRYEGRQILVSGSRMDVIRDFKRLLLSDPMDEQQWARVFEDERSMFVSEAFARHFKKRRGDAVALEGTWGRFEGRIANIFYDYSSDQGVIIIPREIFESIYGKTAVQGMTVYLQSPADSAHLAERLAEDLRPFGVRVRDNVSLRREVLHIFDETFRITYAVQLVALLVALGVIGNVLSMLTLERMREFAVFRAIGASRHLLAGMVRAEALLIAWLSIVCGWLLGIGLALILVYVVNRHFFGWSVVLSLSSKPFLVSGGLSLLLALIVGEIHGRRVASRINSELLRYE